MATVGQKNSLQQLQFGGVDNATTKMRQPRTLLAKRVNSTSPANSGNEKSSEKADIETPASPASTQIKTPSSSPSPSKTATDTVASTNGTPKKTTTKSHTPTKSSIPRVNTTPRRSSEPEPPSPISSGHKSPNTAPDQRLSFGHVRSRVGSLDNIKHTPKGGDKRIFSEKPDFSKVHSRVGSLDNIKHTPKSAEKKIISVMPDFSNVKSRVGSLDNIDHSPPKSAEKKIISVKPDFSNVKSRVGSLDNIDHSPPKSTEKKIISVMPDFSNVKSRVGSLDNIDHSPKGGSKKIFSRKPDFSNVTSRIGSLENISHVPKSSDAPIFSKPLKFKNVKSRVGSLDNVQHIPGGGDVVIFNEKLNFRENASPRVDAGTSSKSNDSSIITDEELLNLIYNSSPTSSSPLREEVPETSSPPGELMTPTPFRVALSPIAELIQPHPEDEQEEQGQEDATTATTVKGEIPAGPKQNDKILEEKKAIVKGKKAPVVEEKQVATVEERTAGGSEPVDTVEKVTSVEPIVKEDHNPPREIKATIREKIALLEAKSTTASAKNATETNNVQVEKKLQDSTSKAEDEGEEEAALPVEVNSVQLDDTDLSFKVNVARQSKLLADAARIREDIPPAIEVPPPQSKVTTAEPELSDVQRQAYDSSWI